MTRLYFRIAISLGLVLPLVGLWVLERARVSANATQSPRPATLGAQLSDQVAVHAARRGLPHVNLSDGHDLRVPFDGGSDATAQAAARDGGLTPLAMASADLDEDGIADLVCSYDSPHGAFIAVYRGNGDAIAPNSLAARQRRAASTFTAAPFLAPARLFATPVAGEWLVTGDVNGDGHADVVITSRASRSLYVMAGEGKGGIRLTKEVALHGTATALAVGDINRRDGLIDLLVGIASDSGPRALVYESPSGAVNAAPEVFALTEAASDFAVGQLDDDPAIDIAVAAGHSLLLIHGRDRERLAGEPARVNFAATERRDFSFDIKAMTSGQFGEGGRSEIGLLADDGAMYVVRDTPQPADRRTKKRASHWAIEQLATAQADSTRLLAAHVSSLPADSLIVLDAGGQQVRIVETTAPEASASLARYHAAVDLEVEGVAVAALPMRLNADAIDDLLILRRGVGAPTMMTSVASAILKVSNTGDNGGMNPAAQAGTGTLRQAIVDANAAAGADEIDFNIGSGPQTIMVMGPLPTITEAVTINGASQPGGGATPPIELRGTLAGSVTYGLNIQTNNVAVSGLVINGFGAFGIAISGDVSNNNIIDGNFIGTDASGSTALANQMGGIVINGAPGNQIGTAAGGGNLISGNAGPGVSLTGSAAGNQVRGNQIGTNAAGSGPVANSGAGVDINNVTGNTIGSPSGSGNLISGNSGGGISTRGGIAGTLVQGNRIGTDASGAAVPNINGIILGSATTGATIGGTGAGAGNVIALNTGAGIKDLAVDGGSNSILGNAIFSNATLGIDLNGDGVSPNDNCDGDTGANNLQNFPSIAQVTGGSNLTVKGTLNSTANTPYRVEFFMNTSCDAPGNGEGETYIGSTNVTTDASCNAMFNAILPVTAMPGNVITATATDPTGATSEFSPCVVVPAAASASLYIELGGAPNPVQAGDIITYSMGFGNAGPDAATNPILSADVPEHTTFVSVSAPNSTWGCSAPPVGGMGTIICSKSTMNAGENGEFTIVVRVDPATPGGTVITFTADVSSSTPDPDTSNNSGTVMTTVMANPCAPTCPADITANSNPTRCGANVDYPVPTVPSDCGQVTCTPSPGSFFAVGSTTVTCTLVSMNPGGPPPSTCSFVVTVLDRTPPVIACPGNITTGTSSGKNTAVVDYPIAAATDACGVANVVCLPPSGSTFSLGTSTVTCTARDVANNTTTCIFTVTVNDREAPAIRCPENVNMTLPATQTSVVVNYPLPTVTDNQPGVTVTCAPPSGSTFPLGTTTVNCAAIDVSGNRATCGFSILLTGGPTSVNVVIPTGQPNLAFTTATVRRKHRAIGPCASFSIVNNGFSRVTLSLDAILRTGSDVTSGRISDPREGDTYLLSLINADGSERPLSLGDTLAVAAGGRLNFCLRFSPAIPALAGSSTGLSAPQAIPDLVTSRVVFGIAGGGTLPVNVNANVDTALQLINPNNPRKPPQLTFTQSGDEFTVSFTVYDSNMDVSRARYEFLDASGAVVAGPFDVDLGQIIRDRNLVRGQSFTVTQRFTGANSNPNISAVRVTVFDGETSVTSPTIVLGTAASIGVQPASRQHVTALEPPAVRLDSPWR